MRLVSHPALLKRSSVIPTLQKRHGSLLTCPRSPSWEVVELDSFWAVRVWTPCCSPSALLPSGSPALPDCSYSPHWTVGVWKDVSLFVVVESLSPVWLLATPWTAACQPFLSFSISWSLLRFMSSQSVMLSSHLILCRPFFCLQSFLASGSFPVSQHLYSRLANRFISTIFLDSIYMH